MGRAWIIAFIVCLAATGVHAQPATDRVTDAYAAGDRLWVLGDDGGLISIDLTAGRQEAIFDEGVVDIAGQDGVLWVLRHDRQESQYLISKIEDGAAATLPEFEDASDRIYRLGLWNAEPVLLSMGEVWVLDGARWRVRIFPTDGVGRRAVPRALDAGGDLYLSFAAGEWGGGVMRLSPEGSAALVERRDGDDLCAGPLNAECDPVHALVRDPASPECVLAGIGQSHMGVQRGRVVRICRSEVELVFTPPAANSSDLGLEMSSPVLDLAVAGDRVWVLTAEGFYSIDETGRAERVDLTNFENISGVWVDRSIPGLLVIQGVPSARAESARRAVAFSSGAGYGLMLVAID